MDLFDQVSEDIKNAMKVKDKVALETLRNIKKFFLEAKTAPGANDTLTDDAALKIIQKLVKQGKDSAEIYIGQGRQDLADTELAQVAVMENYCRDRCYQWKRHGQSYGSCLQKIGRTCGRTCYFCQSKRAFGINSHSLQEILLVLRQIWW